MQNRQNIFLETIWEFFGSLYRSPLYFAELLFIFTPFLFLQTIPISILSLIYQDITSQDGRSANFNSNIFFENFNSSWWFFITPLAIGLLIKLLSKLLRRDLVLTWKHWFGGIIICDALIYLVAIPWLIRYGVFQMPSASIFWITVVIIFSATVLFTFLHFYVYEKMNKSSNPLT